MLEPTIAGLTSYVFTPAEEGQLATSLLKKIRALRKGKATSWTELGVPTVSSAQAVWKWMKIQPVEVILQIRRLLFWQELVAHPESHAQLIALLFGKFRVEEKPTLLPSGRLAYNANCYAERFVSDIEALHVLDEGPPFTQLWGQRVPELFEPTEVRDMFLKLDPRQLGAKYIATAQQQANKTNALPNFSARPFNYDLSTATQSNNQPHSNTSNRATEYEHNKQQEAPHSQPAEQQAASSDHQETH